MGVTDAIDLAQDSYDAVLVESRPLTADRIQMANPIVMQQLLQHARLGQNQILLSGFVRVNPPTGAPSAWDTLSQLQRALAVQQVPSTIMIYMSSGATARLSDGTKLSTKGGQLPHNFSQALQVRAQINSHFGCCLHEDLLFAFVSMLLRSCLHFYCAGMMLCSLQLMHSCKGDIKQH